MIAALWLFLSPIIPSGVEGRLPSTDCASCHAAVAAEFAQSRHAHARRLPVFALSLAHAEGRSWCLSCHQPEGTGDGHTCSTCHRGESALRNAKGHPVLATSPCARCHEFTAPIPGHLAPVVLSDQPLQSTVSEQLVGMPSAKCVTCHDPHRATGGHDLAMLRRAVTVDAKSIDGGVVIALSVGKTGHRFPTGDPFRRLVVASCNDAQCTDVVGRKVFSRSLGLREGLWTTLRDTTLGANERISVTLPAAPFWSVRYFFGDPQFESQLPEDEVFRELESGQAALEARGGL